MGELYTINIKPRRINMKALLVIDMLNDFINEDGAIVHSTGQI